jgi:hypothetical protein
MAYNNLRIGENHIFYTDVSLGVRRLVWGQEAVGATPTRPTTFTVIEGYSSLRRLCKVVNIRRTIQK